MKRAAQLNLFPPDAALPSRPFVRWHRRVQEVQICYKCGREIVMRRLKSDGTLISEFVSAAGECLVCDRAVR